MNMVTIHSWGGLVIFEVFFFFLFKKGFVTWLHYFYNKNAFSVNSKLNMDKKERRCFNIFSPPTITEGNDKLKWAQRRMARTKRRLEGRGRSVLNWRKRDA